VMFAMVDFHGLRVDVRLERVVRIRKIGECVCHDVLLINDSVTPAAFSLGQAANKLTTQPIRTSPIPRFRLG